MVGDVAVSASIAIGIGLGARGERGPESCSKLSLRFRQTDNDITDDYITHSCVVCCVYNIL